LLKHALAAELRTSLTQHEILIAVDRSHTFARQLFVAAARTTSNSVASGRAGNITARAIPRLFAAGYGRRDACALSRLRAYTERGTKVAGGAGRAPRRELGVVAQRR